MKKLSFCMFCLYNRSNDISYMNHIMARHYRTAYGCGKCLKEVFLFGKQLKAHLRVCAGLPKGNTTSLSDKEPMPQGTPENSQDRLRCSQHVKKKSDSAKESSPHSKVHKSHKKSKHLKEGNPKKENWDKTDKHKSKSPARSRPSPSLHLCSPSLHARSSMDNIQGLSFLVMAFNHFSTFHYSFIFL